MSKIYKIVFSIMVSIFILVLTHELGHMLAIVFLGSSIQNIELGITSFIEWNTTGNVLFDNYIRISGILSNSLFFLIFYIVIRKKTSLVPLIYSVFFSIYYFIGFFRKADFEFIVFRDYIFFSWILTLIVIIIDLFIIFKYMIDKSG